MAAQNLGELSSAELIEKIRAERQMSTEEMGAAIGRSGRMVRKVIAGQASGASYHRALSELYQSGRVQHVPPRRRGKNGELAKVRAKAGAGTPTVTPTEATPKRSPRRPFSSETTFLGDGNRIHVIQMPKSRGSKGREQGIQELRRRITNVARGSKYKDKRVRLQATVDIGGGRTRTLDVGSKGGYLASDIVADVRDRAGGDMTAWMRGQMGDRYVEEMNSKAQVVSVTMTTFNAARSKEQRMAQDQAGSRRWNRTWTGSRWR